MDKRIGEASNRVRRMEKRAEKACRLRRREESHMESGECEPKRVKTMGPRERTMSKSTACIQVLAHSLTPTGSCPPQRTSSILSLLFRTYPASCTWPLLTPPPKAAPTVPECLSSNTGSSNTHMACSCHQRCHDSRRLMSPCRSYHRIPWGSFKSHTRDANTSNNIPSVPPHLAPCLVYREVKTNNTFRHNVCQIFRLA